MWIIWPRESWRLYSNFSAILSKCRTLALLKIAPPPSVAALQLEINTSWMSGKQRKKPGKWSGSQKSQEAGDVSSAGKYAELFQEYKVELEAGQDRHERLVKLSRDCTIHSKRTIFSLHQFSGGTLEEDKAKILSEAERKIEEEIGPLLSAIAVEIGGRDPHKHHRAYSPGVQEFIEALAYYRYLKSGRLISFKEAQDFLTFQPTKPAEVEETEKSDIPKDVVREDSGVTNEVVGCGTSEVTNNEIVLELIPSDFILGLADLTGELMRLCINSVGSGNRELPFSLLPFFRALFCGFNSFGSGVRYMNQKMSVLNSSLGKVENVCYTLKIRGSEIPKHMLMDVINAAAQVEHDGD